MDRFTFSGRRGEYCATCFNVLFVDPGLADAVRYISMPGEANVLGSKHAPKSLGNTHLSAIRSREVSS